VFALQAKSISVNDPLRTVRLHQAKSISVNGPRRTVCLPFTANPWN